MDAGGSMHEWYRFLDARSDDEAVCELLRHSARLERRLRRPGQGVAEG